MATKYAEDRWVLSNGEGAVSNPTGAEYQTLSVRSPATPHPYSMACGLWNERSFRRQ